MTSEAERKRWTISGYRRIRNPSDPRFYRFGPPSIEPRLADEEVIEVMPVSEHEQAIERLERERDAAVEGLRSVRDTSISFDDAIHIAIEALRDCGVVPEPTFDAQVQEFLAEHQSLGARLQRLAAGEEEITREMLTGPMLPRLLDDLRCAGCERQDREGFPGLCDGCLDALGDEAS
jgi:hypothetical protein